LPTKAERPKVVISWPRAKPCATSALPVLPVAPKTNNRIDANYTLPARDRYVFEKLDIIPQRGNQDFTHSAIIVPGRPLDLLSWLGNNLKGLAWTVVTARKFQTISAICCYIGRSFRNLETLRNPIEKRGI
jgi:hypothetical protein